MKEFIPVVEAKSILQAQKLRGLPVILPLNKALGKVCALSVLAPMDVPSFDNSGMDGFAIAWDEKGEGREVFGVIQAGYSPDFVLEKGKAVRIFTGAPIPEGADTVIPQEFVDRTGEMIFFDSQKFFRGIHVRKKGAQCRTGTEVIPAGTKITPGTIGLMASLGLQQVEVFPAPKVSLILTGDEIVEMGNPLRPGEIYNANGPSIRAALESLGITDVTVYKVKDDQQEVTKTVEKALKNADFLLLTGGISVGDYDFVKGSLEQNGVNQLFYKIRQRPGKPLFVGRKEEKMIFALPGNPASVLTCFIQYVKPCLLDWMGNPGAWDGPKYYPLSRDFEKKVDLTFFLKAKLEQGKITLLPAQESFNLLSFGVADGLVEVPETSQHLEEGSLLAFYPW